MTVSEQIAEALVNLLFKADRCGTVSARDFAELIEIVSLVSVSTGASGDLSKTVRRIQTNNGTAVATLFEDTFIFENGNEIKIKAIEKSITISLIKNPYTEFKFIQKGFGNENQEANEIGDIFCGWTNDGLIRYSEARWVGGLLSNSDNFIPLVQTEV